MHALDASLAQERPCNETDVGCVGSDEAGWLSWRPATDPASFANSLRVIRGGQVYLIDADAATRLSMVGRPVGGSVAWFSGWNLAGGFVSPQSPPSFAAYFRGSPAHQNLSVYQLNSAAQWGPVEESAPMVPGKGYWISATSSSTYSGPVDIDRFTLRGIDFGRNLAEHPVTVEALGSDPDIVAFSYTPSLPAQGTAPAVAGDVPLLIKRLQESGPEPGWFWTPLPGTYSIDLGSAPRTVRMGMDRNDGLPPALIQRDGTGQAYQGLLEISDGRGFQRLVSVAGQMAGNTGLWVGTTTVDKVAWVHAGLMGETDDISPRPTASPFSFRVLMHVDDQGAVKLLSEVMLMWDDQADAHVLVTPGITAAELARLKPTALQDGQSFTRRISTAGYSVETELAPLPGSATFGVPGTALRFQLELAPDDPLNPFKHAFHPDHDEPGDSYAITRIMTFNFDTLENGVWRGSFDEDVEGINKPGRTVKVSGTFEISNVSTIGNLN